MGIFDKLKNALFEEEYVEVEEKPKTKQVTKKINKKEVNRDSIVEDKYRDEKPIAKKIVLPEKRDVRVETYDDDVVEDDVAETVGDTFRNRNLVEEDTHEHQFKVMDDRDFTVDDGAKYYPEVEPQIVKVIERDVRPAHSYESDRLYQGKIANQPYGSFDTPRNTAEAHLYENKKEESTHFKPSPIISPIYGVLDKNYKKEDVVSRKEVRFTSSFARENLNVDDIREKAFGNNNTESTVEVEEKKVTTKPTFEVETTSNLLVDLSSDDSKPSVKDVTVGDAVEYFEDLGLEYNVDYLDASQRASGRRVKDNYDDEDTIPAKKNGHDEPKIVDVKDDSLDTDDNLFDLIDSMYQE